MRECAASAGTDVARVRARPHRTCPADRRRLTAVRRRGVASRPMRILLWHGYLLGGTGSNVYTRALAREWSRAGPRRRRRLAGARAEQYDLGGAEDRRRRPARRPAASLRHGPLRGPQPEVPAGLHRGRASCLRRGERGGAARAPAGRPRVREPRADGRPGRLRRAVRRSASRRTAPSSSTRCAAARSSERGRGRRSRGPRRPTSARSTSARCSRTSSGTSTASSRCRRASTSTSSCCRTARGGARRPARGGARRSAERRRRAAARRRQRRPARRVPRRSPGRSSSTSGS